VVFHENMNGTYVLSLIHPMIILYTQKSGTDIQNWDLPPNRKMSEDGSKAISFHKQMYNGHMNGRISWIHGLTSFLPSPQAGATQPKKLTKVGSSESKIGRLPLK
jgi:hypothetical protein